LRLGAAPQPDCATGLPSAPFLCFLSVVKMLWAGYAIPLVRLLTLWGCQGLKMTIPFLKEEREQIPSGGGVDALNDTLLFNRLLCRAAGVGGIRLKTKHCFVLQIFLQLNFRCYQTHPIQLVTSILINFCLG